MKVLWVGFMLFLIVVGYEATRPPADREPQPSARDAVRETKAGDDVSTLPVVTRGVSVVPGAIVCPDFPTLKLVFSLYTESVAEQLNNEMTKGLSSARDGPPSPIPDLGLYGCALVPTGTPMKQKNVEAMLPGVPVVIVRLPNGERITGLTLPSMISMTPEGLKNQQELKQEQEQRYAEMERRYAEIVQPEMERHAAAVQHEEDRHVAVMRQLHPNYTNMFVQTDIDSANPGQLVGVECAAESNETNLKVCSVEVARYISAMQDETQRHRSAQAAAREQAAHPKSD
jgi:hypothetical protein